jgi:uncharacterized protein (TIRG00374 family)
MTDTTTQYAEPSRGIGKIIQTALKIAVAGALLGWLIYEGVFDFTVLRKLTSPSLILFLVACTFTQVFINNYRWLVLLRGQGFQSTIRATLPLSLIGIFFNFAMPGGVGGDVVKGYYAVQLHPQQKLAAALSIFVDRLIGFFVMIGTAVVACIVGWSTVSETPQLKSIAFATMFLFLGFLVFFFLSLSSLLQNSKLGHFLFFKCPGGTTIHKLYQILHAYRKSPRALLQAVVLSFAAQLLIVAFVYAIGYAMDVSEIPLSGYFFLVPISTVAQAIPIAPAGIGVGQAAAFFLFKLYLGKEIPLGPISVTAAQLTMLFWGMAGLYFYLTRKKPDAISSS